MSTHKDANADADDGVKIELKMQLESRAAFMCGCLKQLL